MTRQILNGSAAGIIFSNPCHNRPVMKRGVLRQVALGAAVLAMATLFGISCSDGDSPGGANGGSPDTGDELDDTDAFSGTGDSFEAQVGRFSEAMEAATDRCTVLAATDLIPVAVPTDSVQAEVAMAALLLQLDKMASTTDSTEISNLLRSSAVGLGDFAEEVDNDPELLDLGGDGPDTPATEDYRKGLTLWFAEAGRECSAATFDE